MTSAKSSGGFSLIGLAIVLVIIGLIVGGILVASSMIRSAQIQSVISDQDFYRKSVQTFKDKYQALPGDMPNATTFWGQDPAGCPAASYSATPHTTTCNGDGNGRIEGAEMYLVWQHLTNAGMITGGYTDMSGSSTYNYPIAGSNVPASQVPLGAYILYFQSPLNSGTNLFPGNYGHIIMFGTPVQNGDSIMGPILTPSEALLLDSKIDDGLPGTGNVTTSLIY